MRGLSVGQEPAPTAWKRRQYNPSVFALRLTNLRTYVSKKKIHEGTRGGLIHFHQINFIRALIERIDSKLAGVGNSKVRQLGRHLCRPNDDQSPEALA